MNIEWEYVAMTTYLAHHGILGQKWGVRRYQNEDGTLTAAGKKELRRRRNGNKIAGDIIGIAAKTGFVSDETADRVAKEIGANAVDRSKKYDKFLEKADAARAKTMSDAELKTVITRLSMEKKYRQLAKEDRDAGSGFLYDNRRETIKDVMAYAAPILSAIVTPFVAAGVKKLTDSDKKSVEKSMSNGSMWL